MSDFVVAKWKLQVWRQGESMHLFKVSHLYGCSDVNMKHFQPPNLAESKEAVPVPPHPPPSVPTSCRASNCLLLLSALLSGWRVATKHILEKKPVLFAFIRIYLCLTHAQTHKHTHTRMRYPPFVKRKVSAWVWLPGQKHWGEKVERFVSCSWRSSAEVQNCSPGLFFCLRSNDSERQQARRTSIISTTCQQSSPRRLLHLRIFSFLLLLLTELLNYHYYFLHLFGQ